MAMRTPVRSSARRASIAGGQTPAISKCSVHVDENSPEGDNFSVDFQEEHLSLTTVGLLGCGGFGKVYLARTPSGDTYALKVSSKRLASADHKRLREELAIMNIFREHPNIVKFRNAAIHDGRAYVVMERCVPKSLHDLIGLRPLDFPEVLWIGYQMCETIAFMHSKGCIHRDLKPQNLLFDFQGNLKVTDFGLSSRLSGDNPRKTVAGTAIYMAPEMAAHYLHIQQHKGPKQDLQYSTEIDVWSIGVVLFVIATRNSPYARALQTVKFTDPKERQAALFNAVARAKWQWPEGFNGDDQFIDLVERVLSSDGSKRPTTQDILEHPVWEMRPLTCPLSLMHSLCLVDPSARGSARRSLTNAAGINAPPKITKEHAIRNAKAKIEAVENERRTMIVAESIGLFDFFSEVEDVFRGEVEDRLEILNECNVSFSKLRNQQRTMLARRQSQSVALAETAVRKNPPPPAARIERSVSVSANPVLLGQDIRRSPTGGLVVSYPGRDSATKWSLRREVSIPQDLIIVSEIVRCMNGHQMTKMTRIPPGYAGFDCNACDIQLDELSTVNYIWRCHKCDYDICSECATTGKQKPMPFACASCGKVFPSAQKMHKHSLNCRGPSMSPSPERIGNTRATILQGESPLEEAMRRSGRLSSTGRVSTGRLSLGTRMSTGPVSRMDELDLPPPRFWSPPQHSPVHTDFRLATVAEPRKSPSNRASARVSVEALPVAEKRPREQYKLKMADVDIEEEPEKKSARMESPKEVPAAPAPSHERSRARSNPTQGMTTIQLSANQAVRPSEMRKAEVVPRKAYSSARGASRSQHPQQPPPAVEIVANAAPPPEQPQKPIGPQNPRTPVSAVRVAVPSAPAASTVAVSPKPQAALAHRTTPGQPLQGGFLALPQDAAHRKRFLEEFLGGPWVRSFTFSSNDVAILYYCLQPGRHGAVFPVEDGIGTVVVDTRTKTVLYVPLISKEETGYRPDPHPHVQTFYDEEVRILSMSEAMRQVGAVVTGILNYVAETCRVGREELPSTSIRAAYLHDQDQLQVPPNTKFAYVRRVFPEENGMFALFRLSNMRSHIVCNTAPIDIRWYSDRHKNVTLKYYVHADGSAEPFSVDSTGIMVRLERMLTQRS